MTTSASLITLKPLTVWITTNCGKNLKEMGIIEQLICLLRNLYVGQKAMIRAEHGTMDWFKIVKRVSQGLYSVTLLIQILCRVYHVKCWAG